MRNKKAATVKIQMSKDSKEYMNLLDMYYQDTNDAWLGIGYSNLLNWLRANGVECKLAYGKLTLTLLNPSEFSTILLLGML